VTPKGWPEVRVPRHDLAAKETFEEAELIGEIVPEGGDFTYEKCLNNRQTALGKVSANPP
jgi:hypothetical protein